MYHLSTVEADEALEDLFHFRRTAVPAAARLRILRNLVLVDQRIHSAFIIFLIYKINTDYFMVHIII